MRADVYSHCSELLGTAVRIIFGCEIRDMSLLYFLWYVRSAGSIEALIDTKVRHQTHNKSSY